MVSKDWVDEGVNESATNQRIARVNHSLIRCAEGNPLTPELARATIEWYRKIGLMKKGTGDRG
jgi:hypothetical protein